MRDKRIFTYNFLDQSDFDKVVEMLVAENNKVERKKQHRFETK